MSAPEGRLRTLVHASPLSDTRGEVRFWVGNSAVVFIAEGDWGADGTYSAGTDETASGVPRLSLKCFTRWSVHAVAVYDYVAEARDELLPHCRMLRDEFFVHDAVGAGAWYDVVASRWTEGITLQTALRRASHEGGFAELSASFERLAVALLGREWAHGDLKPENIIVSPDGEMSLIDLDAMWIPSLEGESSAEVGTPQYQHPARDERYFCKAIDDFPVALMAVSLRALAIAPTLWGHYHDGDNMILYPEQVVQEAAGLGSGEETTVLSAYDEVLRLFSERGEYHSLRLAHALYTPTPAIGDLREMLIATSADTVQWAYGQEDSGLFDHQTKFSEGRPAGANGGAEDIGGADNEPVAAVCAHGVWKIVHTHGTVRASCLGWDYVKPFSEGIAAARQGEKWGYITANGQTIVEPRFDMAATMHEGRAAVGMRCSTTHNGGMAGCESGGAGSKYGYIDALGAIVVHLEWDYAGSFRSTRAIVSRGDTDFIIDRDGKIIN